jgi:hypothetical protein
MRAHRSLVPVAALALSSACILTTGGDDEPLDEEDTGGPSTVTLDGSASEATSVADSGSDDGQDGSDSEGGSDTGGPMGECTANLVLDPGFEAGTPSSVWDEGSEVFGTPICNAGCTDEPGAGPYAGDWYAWYGGLEALEDGTPQPDSAWVAQTVNIPAGDNAWLSFRFEINAASGTGADVLAVEIDDVTVFMATDAEIDDYPEYAPVQVDVSAFADGADHVLRVGGELGGIEVTNFFVDEIALVSCDAGGSDSSSSSDGSGSSGSSGSDSSGSGSGDSSGSEGSGSGGSSGG